MEKADIAGEKFTDKKADIAAPFSKGGHVREFGVNIHAGEEEEGGIGG